MRSEALRKAQAKYYKKNRESLDSKHKQWAKDNPIAYRTIMKRGMAKWVASNPDKRRAHKRLNTAIERGKMTKPEFCTCGNKNVQGHHADYSKALEVEWLCQPCHKGVHQ